jgi:hypothetical protein
MGDSIALVGNFIKKAMIMGLLTEISIKILDYWVIII